MVMIRYALQTSPIDWRHAHFRSSLPSDHPLPSLSGFERDSGGIKDVIGTNPVVAGACRRRGRPARAASPQNRAARHSAPPSSGVVIRLTGSDTMVNLNQAWAENYKTSSPDVSVQVAGGGSGVGIAGPHRRHPRHRRVQSQDGARGDRESDEVGRAPRRARFVVGLDALAVYVHKDNPLRSISIEDLAEIYGDGGQITKWSQLGVQEHGLRRRRRSSG